MPGLPFRGDAVWTYRWITTTPLGPKPSPAAGARYCAETAITLAMTSADTSINFMFDFPRPRIGVKSHSTLTAQLRQRSGKIAAKGKGPGEVEPPGPLAARASNQGVRAQPARQFYAPVKGKFALTAPVSIPTRRRELSRKPNFQFGLSSGPAHAPTRRS
jgi:hypothetical protein